MNDRLPHPSASQGVRQRHRQRGVRQCRAWSLGCLCVCLLPRMALAQVHSRAELRADVARLQGAVHACEGAAAACNPRVVPEDNDVPAEGAQPGFTMHWDWLRQAFETAASHAKAGTGGDGSERVEAMQASAARLEELDREITPSVESASLQAAQRVSFAKARHTADGVLARVEFDKVAPPSWWDRLLARFWAAVGRFFDGIGQLGQQAPWLGRALELLLFCGAAVGLLFFVRRNFQRQRLAASLRGEHATRTAWDRDATDWAALADRAAAAGDWREAVHCLYWAAIVRLENGRAWRHNPARTPRDYVRLLKPGSVQRESLGGLTKLLERVWYGLRPAGAAEYGEARSWLEQLGEGGTAASASRKAVGSEQA